MSTITHLYDSYPEAERVVGELEAAGVPHDDISIVGRNAATSSTTGHVTDTAHTGAGAGASLGTVIGGGAGLLAGIGALAIPGIGPVVAAGWLIATVTGAGAGAAAGGLLGSLTGAGVPEQDAHVYAEGVRRGGTLVSVRTIPANVEQVRSILAGGAVDVAHRRTAYEQEGWTAHDPAAADYPTAVGPDGERDLTRRL